MAENSNSQAISVDDGQSRKPKYQWLRYAEVIINDFNDKSLGEYGKAITVPNDLEIEFDFFKSVDDSTQNSTGTIKIKGLSEERCSRLSESGGEVTLKCGYMDNVVALFRAYIMRLTSEIIDNTTVTTIECSMNLQEFYYSVSSSLASAGVSSKDITLNSLLRNYAYACGFSNIAYYASKDMSPQEKSKCEEIFNSISFAYEVVSTAEEALDGICGTFGLIRESKIEDSGSILQLTATKETLKFVSENNFKRISKEQVKANANDLMSFRTYYEAVSNDALSNVTILSKETGLLSARVEYKIAKAYRDQQLLSTDEETFKSQKQTEKFISNEKKRKEKGLKDLKPFKAKSIKNEIQVNRKFIKVVALLNPNVKPQSPVAIVQKSYNDEGAIVEQSIVGRARSVTYKGNNKSGDWIMELYVETSPENDTELTPEQIQQLKNAQDDGQTYSKNPNSSGDSFSGNYKYNYPDNMQYDQVKNLGFRTPIQNSKGDHYEPLSGGKTKGSTLEFAKVLDDDGLGGNMKRFTAFSDGYHIGRKSAHNTGKAFDLSLNTTDVNTVARVRQDIINKGAETGYILKVTAEHPQGAKMGLTGFKWYPHSTGVHIHVEVLGKM